MTLAAPRRAGLVLRVWLALACAILAPAAALALDASQLPPLRGKSVETPSLVLGGGITCIGATCDASPLTVLGPQSGAQPYSLAEQALDRVNVMAFIPKALRPGVRARTNTTDLTPYVQAALNTGKNVHFPLGDYKVCDMLSQKRAQRLTGDGVTVSRLTVGTCFNMNAAAVVQATPSAQANGTPGEQSAGWDQIGLVFNQSGITSRAGLRQYPWALDINGQQRYKIGNLRISNAWNGVKGVGTPSTPNASGFTADLLELGAFNRGILLDGLYDFTHITTLHCWPWDVAETPPLLAVATDGNTVCAEFGRIDGLDIKTLNTYGSSVLSNANGSSGAARQIGMMQLDGAASFFHNVAGDWQIGILSSTDDGSIPASKVRWDSGDGIFSSVRLWGGSILPSIVVNGGNLIAGGGFIQNQYDTIAVEAAGGTTMLNNILFVTNRSQNTGMRTQPVVHQSSGLLHMVGNRWERIPGNTVTLVKIDNDSHQHYIAGNAFNTAGFVKPSGTLNGTYAPNGP